MPLFCRTTSLSASGLFNAWTDCHCHLLPAVDDGVQSLPEALQVLTRLEQLGVGEMWLTPHVMEDYPNTTAGLRRSFDDLRAAYSGPIRLRLSAEHMLDHLFEERLLAGDVLPYGRRSQCLLVETSCVSAPLNLHHLLELIVSKGYRPVLAHPERYLYMNRDDYSALRRRGVQFQLNVPSAAGAYGTEVKRRAEWLLGQGWYEFAGSDLHSLDGLNHVLSLRGLKRRLVPFMASLPQPDRD